MKIPISLKTPQSTIGRPYLTVVCPARSDIPLVERNKRIFDRVSTLVESVTYR